MSMEVFGSLLTFCDSTFWSLVIDIHTCYLIEDNSIQCNRDVSPESHGTTFATLSKAGWQQNQDHFVLQFAQINSAKLSYYPKHQKCTSTVVGFIIRRSYSLIYGSFAPTASNSGRCGLIARHFASAYRPK